MTFENITEAPEHLRAIISDFLKATGKDKSKLIDVMENIGEDYITFVYIHDNRTLFGKIKKKEQS